MNILIFIYIQYFILMFFSVFSQKQRRGGPRRGGPNRSVFHIPPPFSLFFLKCRVPQMGMFRGEKERKNGSGRGRKKATFWAVRRRSARGSCPGSGGGVSRRALPPSPKKLVPNCVFMIIEIIVIIILINCHHNNSRRRVSSPPNPLPPSSPLPLLPPPHTQTHTRRQTNQPPFPSSLPPPPPIAAGNDKVGRPLLHQAGAHDLDGRYDDRRRQAMSSTRRHGSRCLEEGCRKNTLDVCMNIRRTMQVSGLSCNVQCARHCENAIRSGTGNVTS